MPDLLSDADMGIRPSSDGPALLSDADMGINAPSGKEVPLAVRPLVGANRVISSMAGAPVDAATWLINNAPGTLLVNKGAEALGFKPPIPKIENPFGGSESIKRGMGLVGANPDEVRPAETAGERVLEATGEGAASMLVPGLGAEALLTRSLREGASLGAQLSKIIAGAGTASNTAIGAAGGALGEVAAEAVPPGGIVQAGPLSLSTDALRETARLGGNIAGGIPAAGALSGVEAAGRAVGSAVRAATEPAELRAARTIMGRAEDPGAIRQAAQEASEAPALVPKSEPTLFQSTGDLGVGGLEREVAASPKGVPRFAGVREEQNSARLAELDNLQKALPENADPHDVAAYVQGRVQQLEQTFGERVTAARNQLDEAFKAGQLNEAEYGAALRETPLRLRTQLETIEDDLWRAVDPDKQVPFNPTDLKAGFSKIEKDIPRTAKGPEAEEASILDVVLGPKDRETGVRQGGLDDQTTFGEVAALRSRLTDALRDRTLTPTVNRRVTLMLKDVDKALENTGLAVPGMSNSEAAIGSTLDRYAAARAATRDVKSRFGEGAVGSVLKEGDRDGFRMTASNVAKNIFDRPEDLRAYLTAVGDDAAARAQLQDYAAFSLRKAAVRDGMMSDSKYQKWMADHEYVLKEFPELRAQFGSMRAAQTAMDDALTAQKQALADYQTGAIKRLLNTQDPEQVITNALKRPGEFAALAEQVANDPAAKAGMKRAVIDFMMKQARSTAEAGTSGEAQINAATLQKFYINNKRSLAALFDPEELASIDAVTRDLQRANRSIAAVRIPGGSNTAQDTAGRMATVLSHLMRHGGATGGVGAGAMFGGPMGAIAGGIAGTVADAMRVARVNSIETALVEMMLDPKMAALWLKQVPVTGAETTASNFARRLKALTAAQVTQAMDEENRRNP